jgi:hypothetical protein
MKRLVKYCAFSALAIGAGTANAQDRSSAVTVFPPIMREMARDTGRVRPWAELTTTPQPVQAVPAARQPELVARGYAEPVAAVVTGALD